MRVVVFFQCNVAFPMRSCDSFGLVTLKGDNEISLRKGVVNSFPIVTSYSIVSSI